MSATIKLDGETAIVYRGHYRPRNAERCQHTGCRRDAQYLCQGCDKLVCGRHGVAPSEEEQFCLKCADAAGVAGVQRDLFQSVRPQGKRPAQDGLDQQRG